MLDESALKTLLISEIKKGYGNEPTEQMLVLIELFVKTMTYIKTNGVVNVTTPGGPGTGNIT